MGIVNPYQDYEVFLKMQSETIDKLEYHNGTIFNMSPTSIKHNDIVNNLMFELKKFFKGSKCKVQSEQIPIIFQDDNSRYEYQPDIFVMCEGKTIGEKYISIPVIVFEVLSKKTASNDLFVKALIYEKFGVQEYNIIHQDGRVIQYGLSDGKYDVVSSLTKVEDYKSTVFDNLKFSLKDIFD
jgi:Uma2 family endonuclease